MPDSQTVTVSIRLSPHLVARIDRLRLPSASRPEMSRNRMIKWLLEAAVSSQEAQK